MQLTQAQLDAALGDLIAASAAFDPAATFVGVASAISTAGLLTTLSDLTPCTGNCATRQPVTTWGAITHLDNQCSAVDGPRMVFRPASGDTAQTVVCWYLASALTAGNLLAYKLLDAPVSLPNQFSEFGLVLRLCLDPNGTWDASVTYDG